jgi:hypothetical protein
MTHRTALACLLTATFPAFLAARPPVAVDLPLPPENRLLGRWLSTTGAVRLYMQDNRSVLMEIAGRGEDARPEPRFGHYTVRNKTWVVTLHDADGRTSVYGVVSHGPSRLSLINARGEMITFTRTDGR